MDRIAQWTAKRAGAGLTIEGIVANGPVKLTRISSLSVDASGPVAIRVNPNGTTDTFALAAHA